jgi:hypothetical protein
MSNEITQADLDKVAGKSSRAAAQELGVGKTTINNARERARENGGVLPPTGDSINATVSGSAVPQTAQEVEDLLVAMGIDRERHEVSLGFSVYDQGDDTKRALRINTRARAKPAVDDDAYKQIDTLSVLAQLRSQSRPHPIMVVDNVLVDDTEGAFVLSINDIQLGQAFNGGSAETIKFFYHLVMEAKLRIYELINLGRNLTTLVIIGGGDLIEGCVIYGNQSFSLDMNRKQQVEGVIALILFAIDELAPLFDNVKVLAARGNHGENRIGGKYTTLDDNDDTHVFEMVKLALSRDESMQHIEWVIAQSEAGVWVDVFQWVLATTHGDVYAKGVGGATTERKAHAWLKNMAAAFKRFGKLGRADVLVTHHFHHDEMADWGDCLWRQTTSQDRGSLYYEQATGTYSEPGMLTFVMTESKRYQDEQVLR